MKKINLIFATLLMVSAMAFAQNDNAWMPHGYQGFLEMNSGFQVVNDGNPTTGLSTTHGFYFNGHTYVGIGFGLDFYDVSRNNTDLAMPFYAAVNYLFSNTSNLSPVVKMRLGSYVGGNHGTYADLGFGIRFGSRRDFAVTVLLTGTYYSNREYIEHESDINVSTVSLRFGIEW